MAHDYPGDITREQFEAVRPLLESARKRTKPRRHGLYDLFRGVLCVLKSGCQWRMLPAEPLGRGIKKMWLARPVKNLAGRRGRAF